MAKQTDQETSQPAETATEAPSRPIAKFSGSGGLNIAVWKNKSENAPEHYSIRLDRTFKNEAGGYESTPYLREGDLLRAQKLLGQIDDWIEQDKAKHRSRNIQGASAGRS
jgi:hypothetical protein